MTDKTVRVTRTVDELEFALGLIRGALFKEELAATRRPTYVSDARADFAAATVAHVRNDGTSLDNGFDICGWRE